MTRQERQSDENIQGILSKARGFAARLSMILFALEQAIVHLDEFEGDDSSHTWSNEITAECVEAAATITDHLIQQKLIMMDVNEVPEGHTPDDSDRYIPHATHLRKLLLLSAEDQDGIISPSSVTRGHISEPTLGKYKVDKALELFGVAHTHGFGDTVELVTPTKRKVKRFRKTPYDLLLADARNVL